jgi:hypothetical protein
VRHALLLLLLLACDQSELGTSTSPIVNGTRAPQVVPLSPEQIRAIGWLHPASDPRDNFCTGTLIAPSLVITAQHCISGTSPPEIGFGIGVEPASFEATYAVAGIYPHEAEDAALLVLVESATLAPGLAVPIAPNDRPIPTSSIGRPLDAAGYGDTYDPTRTGRWFAKVYLDEIEPATLVVDGRGEQGICYGDSGGPLLDVGANGPILLAVESFGDETCVDRDTMVRVDALYDWIEPVLRGELPPEPCEGLDRIGECVGDVARWCGRNFEIRERDCAALGTTCGYIDDEQGHDCVCGDLDFLGRCDGTVLEYCDEGTYRRVECSFRDLGCGWIDGETGYLCTDMPVCRAEDVPGRCDSNVAISCAGGVTTRRLCEVEGLVCRVTADGAECGAAEVDAGSPDALVPDAGSEDAGIAIEDAGGLPPKEEPDPSDDEGCGCSAAGNAELDFLPLIPLLLLRRRRGRA